MEPGTVRIIEILKKFRQFRLIPQRQNDAAFNVQARVIFQYGRVVPDFQGNMPH